MLNSLNNKFFIFLAFFIFVTAGVILLTGCSDKNVINEEKFVSIYTDLVIAGDTTSIKNNHKLLSLILKKHNVTLKKYKATINYYNESEENWRDFFDKVTAKVEEIRKKRKK